MTLLALPPPPEREEVGNRDDAQMRACASATTRKCDTLQARTYAIERTRDSCLRALAYRRARAYDVCVDLRNGGAMSANAGIPRRRRYDAAEREHTRARVELGERGITLGDLYAYAYDERAQRYNVVRLYARADARVTRYLVCERPMGETRERERVRWTLNTAQPSAPVRAFDPWSGMRMHHGQRVALARTSPRIVRVAPGNPTATTQAHACPPMPRDRTRYRACRCTPDGVCRWHADENMRALA